jgi:hypothetical protein
MFIIITYLSNVTPCDLKEEYCTFGVIIPPSAGYKMEAADFL